MTDKQKQIQDRLKNALKPFTISSDLSLEGKKISTEELKKLAKQARSTYSNEDISELRSFSISA